MSQGEVSHSSESIPGDGSLPKGLFWVRPHHWHQHHLLLQRVERFGFSARTHLFLFCSAGAVVASDALFGDIRSALPLQVDDPDFEALDGLLGRRGEAGASPVVPFVFFLLLNMGCVTIVLHHR